MKILYHCHNDDTYCSREAFNLYNELAAEQGA